MDFIIKLISLLTNKKPGAPASVTPPPQIEYITIQDLLGSPNINFFNQEPAIQKNLAELHSRINSLLSLYGKPVKVTSGLRTKEDHARIYANINAKRRAEGKEEIAIPWGSQHLLGCAVDIYDPEKKLQDWTLAHVSGLVGIQLWCEDFSTTTNWVHYQINPPASKNRFFKP